MVLDNLKLQSDKICIKLTAVNITMHLNAISFGNNGEKQNVNEADGLMPLKY